jgi:hypothetical protein
MDPQGSTPDITAGGPSHSLPSSADNNVAQATPSISQDPQNGDLLGRLQNSYETGTPVTETPSQTTPETTTPQAEPQNQGQPNTGDSVAPTSTENVEADPELTKWASSQNIDLNNPTPQDVAKIAKRLRDTQAALHQAKAEKLKQVQAPASDEFSDPLEQDVSYVKNKLARYEFFENNSEAKALEGAMIDYVIDLADRGDEQAARFYSDPANWTHLYNIVKTQNVSSDPGAIIDQGRQIERENLARVQQAAPPRAAANSSAPQPQLSQEQQIANMSQSEYNEWRKTNNPFAA